MPISSQPDPLPSEVYDTSEPFQVDAKGARLREDILAGRHPHPLLCELGDADLLSAHYERLRAEYDGDWGMDKGRVEVTIHVRTRGGPEKWATTAPQAPMTILRSPNTGRISKVIIGDPDDPDRSVQARQMGAAIHGWVESETRIAIAKVAP